MTISVTRRGGTRYPVKISWKTVEDTAREDHHFIGQSGNLDFLPGVRNKVITIELTQSADMFKNVCFTVEIDRIEDILWKRPEANVRIEQEQTKIVLISKMEFAKLATTRIQAVENVQVEISGDEMVVNWSEKSEGTNFKNANCKKIVQILPGSYTGKHENHTPVYSTDLSSNTDLFATSVSEIGLSSSSRYVLRVLSIDFANNREQSEYVGFETGKGLPESLRNLKVTKNGYLSFEGQESGCDEIELLYCRMDNTRPKLVILDNKARFYNLSDCLVEGVRYMICVRAKNEVGYSSTVFTSFVFQDIGNVIG